MIDHKDLIEDKWYLVGTTMYRTPIVISARYVITRSMDGKEYKHFYMRNDYDGTSFGLEGVHVFCEIDLEAANDFPDIDIQATLKG